MISPALCNILLPIISIIIQINFILVVAIGCLFTFYALGGIVNEVIKVYESWQQVLEEENYRNKILKKC